MRKLYRVRNKLFHGALSAPRLSIPDYETKPFEAYFDEVVPVTYTGLALLIGTLQELALRNWHGLSFEEHPFYYPYDSTAQSSK
jgi:hypothetical protein